MMNESPAFGISKIKENVWKDKVSSGYKVECDCGSDDHAITMFVEVFDDDMTKGTDLTNVVLYFDTVSYPPAQTLKSRGKTAWNILRHGHNIEQRDIFLKKQAAINIGNAILESVKHK